MDTIRDWTETMRAAGVRFLPGLTEEELCRAEGLYGIRFPVPLRALLAAGLPCAWDREYGVPMSEEQKAAMFPRWNDFTPSNVTRLRGRLAEPILWLRRDVTAGGFWVRTWGDRPTDPDAAAERFDRLAEEAPRLIPLSGHRYVPSLSSAVPDDPPVFSSVGRDTIRYGADFGEWIGLEFREGAKKTTDGGMTIPFWDEVVGENHLRAEKARMARRRV